ncbi:hypothetical protein NCS52_01222200 [Fusarium sp. LHS14.1]|nr:hypothetical protein NCS52_01222200 [Fusarium sp. LHS14.1]
MGVLAFATNSNERMLDYRSQRSPTCEQSESSFLKYSVDPLDDKMKGLFPDATRRLSFVQVWLQDGSEVGVEGYGLPFSNPGHPSEGWLNRLEPIVEGKTLVDIIDQRHFTFVVHKPCDVLRRDWHENEMPPPFCYPYGTVHGWDLERFDNLICATKGYQFWPSWSFDDQNTHTAALVHSQVQDIRWLCHAAEQIAKQRFIACFVMSKDYENVGDETPSSFAIVSLTSEFLNRYDTPWRHFIRDGFLKLELYNKTEDGRHTSVCDAKILDRPTVIDAVRSAQAAKNELNWVALRFCPNLDDTKRKVDAVCSLQSSRPPSNSIALDAPQLDMYPTGKYTASNELEFRMSLQRALVLGSGFWSVLRRFKAAPASSPNVVGGLEASTARLRLDESVPVTLPCIPDVNLLDIRDPAMLDALMTEVLPADRPRFRRYFSKRGLGFGLMTASPGFGKTTALSVATLSMTEILGPIFASAPTHVAVNTLPPDFTPSTPVLSTDTTRGSERRIVSGASSSSEVTMRRTTMPSNAYCNTLMVPTMESLAPGKDQGLGACLCRKLTGSWLAYAHRRSLTCTPMTVLLCTRWKEN